MNESKNNISGAQKAAQKKYDQKTKMVSIKYTPADMREYEMLKNYLEQTGQSTNGFIKNLINNFFESAQDNKVEDLAKDPVRETSARMEHYHPYSWIADESIQFLYDNFGEETMSKVLDEFYGVVGFELDNILEEKGCNFDDWIKELEEKMNDGEFQNSNNEEICKALINDLCDTI